MDFSGRFWFYKLDAIGVLIRLLDCEAACFGFLCMLCGF